MADGMLMIAGIAPGNYRWLLEQSKRNGTTVHAEAARHLDRVVTQLRLADEEPGSRKAGG